MYTYSINLIRVYAEDINFSGAEYKIQNTKNNTEIIPQGTNYFIYKLICNVTRTPTYENENHNHQQIYNIAVSIVLCILCLFNNNI
jgi:hypothetical protein